MISQTVIDRFLERPVEPLPVFKGAPADQLLAAIEETSGLQFRPSGKTTLRTHQLEGLAFSLVARRALLFYSMQLGKALRIDWPVATPDGWRPIGTLRVGDFVMGQAGQPIQVVGVFPQGRRPMLSMQFTDGAETVCDADHVWSVNTASGRCYGGPWQLHSTQSLMQQGTAYANGRGYKFFVPMPTPIAYPDAELPIDPYMLGVLLGDGSLSRGTPSLTTDQAIVESLALPPGVSLRMVDHVSPGIVEASLSTSGTRSTNSNPITAALRDLGLYGCLSESKFIPDMYLTASVPQRLSMLAGLMDTDGWATPVNNRQDQSNLHWGSVSPQLALDMQELIRSLGGSAAIRTKQPTFLYRGERKQGQLFYHMSVRLPSYLGCPFRLARKVGQWRPLTKFQPQRAIVSITAAAPAEAVCIKVAAPDGLFVIKDYVVTHNTAISLNWAEHLRRAKLWHGKGLVIAHAPIGLEVWQNETAKHSTLSIRGVRSNLDEFADALDSDCDLIAVPWTGLQNMFSQLLEYQPRNGGARRNKRFADHELIRLAAGAFQLCIIDEIHRAKDHRGLWLKIASLLIQRCRFRLGLTGTPIGRDPLAVWAQAYLIDNGLSLSNNYYFFEQAFGKKQRNWFSPKKAWLAKPKTGVLEYVGFDWVFDPDKMPLLRHKLSSLAMSYERAEVAPSQVTPSLIELSMGKPQRTAYKAAIDKVVTLHRDYDPAEMKNSFVRLRQISSGFIPFLDNDGSERMVEFPNSTKLAWLEAMLADLAGAQLVVFHEFTHSGRMLCRLLEAAKISYSWLYGGTKDPADAVRRFHSGKAQVLLANTATGGMSINLSQADYLVYYESPTSPIIRAQADARPMADRGQRPLLITDVVCSPIEHRILGFLREGKDALRELTRRRAGAELRRLLAG